MRTISDNGLGLTADAHATLENDGLSTLDDGQLIVGTSGNDDLWGTDGDDTIRGLGGSDNIQGELGSDRLVGGSGGDYVNDGSGGSDTLEGDGGDDQLSLYRQWYSPTESESVLLDGGAGNDQLYMDGMFFYGRSDVAITGVLDGGDGDDLITLGFANHAVIDAGAGEDTVRAAIARDTTIALGQGADVLHLTGMDVGSADVPALVVADFETGDAGDRLELRDLMNQLIPSWEQDNPFGDGHLRLVQQGDDVMLQLSVDARGEDWRDMVLFQGHQAGDFTAFNLDGFPADGSEPVGEVIQGSGDNDYLEGTTGGDTISGYGGDDTLYGYAGRDKLVGGDNNDYLDGGLGEDTVLGGDGDDYISAGAGDRAVGGKGNDYITLYSAAESSTTLFGGAGADTFDVQLDRAGADAFIAGGDGDDSIRVVGSGHVHVNAGEGDDEVYLGDVGNKADLRLGEGSDTVRLGFYASGVELVTIADFQVGDGGDRLDISGFMSESFNGWDNSTNPFAAGYLRLVQDGDATEVQYSLNADGTWTGLFLLSGVSAADLTAENLSGYPGDGSDPAGLVIHGTKDGEFLYGGIGPDTISAGRGDDEVHGGAGDDKVIGGDGGDALYGDTGHDRLIGGDGYDYLSDFNGGNTLEGGAGNDTLQIHTYVANDGLDILDGGDGDDHILWSNNGLDAHGLIKAGAGDDQIELDGRDSHVHVLLGDGADLVWFDGPSENDGAVDIVDFTAEDRLDLSALVWWSSDFFFDGYMRLGQHGGDTVLQVYYPADTGEIIWRDVVTLDGVLASDITAKQLGGMHPGTIWRLGGRGHDVLTATVGDTHLDGAGGGDVLTGSAKADVLIGGLGADLLTGGDGADVFKYQSAADSTVGGRDVITDLGDSDVIDLSSVDANVWWYGHQSFTLVDQFTGEAGEMVVNFKPASGVTLIMGDTDGDGAADFEIEVKGDHHDFANFVL